MCSIFFDNKSVAFKSIARILRNLDIVSSLLTTSVKCPILMVTYKLGLPLSTKIFNFNQSVSTLDTLDAFLSNPEILPSNCGGHLMQTNIIIILWRVIHLLSKLMF